MPVDLLGQSIIEEAKKLFAQLDVLDEDARIDVINEIRLALSQYSPMRGEPVDCVQWVPADIVHGNDYNPNVVAPPEMELLKLSISEDGFTQPIVVWRDSDTSYEVVDGFHRNRVGKEVGIIRKRIKGRLPITIVNQDRTGRVDRIASTVRHNNARGAHQVDATSELVLEMSRLGMTEDEIMRKLGMERDAVRRHLQLTGLAEAFANRQFSEAWEADLGN